MDGTATLGAVAQSRRARWLYYGHRLLQRLSGGRAGVYDYLIVAQPIGARGGPSLRQDPRTVVREIDPHDSIVAAFPRPAQVNRKRFDAGARCHVVSVSDTFAGHLWLAENGHDEDEVRCRFVLPQRPRCCWDFDVYIEPRFRAGRVMARLWQAVDRGLAADGFDWTLSRIARLNQASLLAHERLGAVPVASASFLIVGPLQIMIASCAPWLHVGIAMTQRPTLLLPAPPERLPLPQGASGQIPFEETP